MLVDALHRSLIYRIVVIPTLLQCCLLGVHRRLQQLRGRLLTTCFLRKLADSIIEIGASRLQLTVQAVRRWSKLDSCPQITDMI